ncbi:MAG TPA: ABC transporter ATP-binding protein [Dehalococcoidia bacterium]
MPASAPPAPDVEPVLRAERLTKRYGRITAVKDVSFAVRPGEVFGFLGPNGAGKSTTVGMLLGLVRPTSGRIHGFGADLATDPWGVLRHVGAIIEGPAFYPYLSGRDNLRILARAIGGVPDRRIDELLELVGLADRDRDRYGTYSLGMKQRLGIAFTLLRDPRLVILDEPTNGLDPSGQREVRELIPRLAAEGRAVFLCSHLLHEVQQVCHRVAILQRGELVAEGDVAALLGRGRALRLRAEDPEALERALRSIPWVEGLSRTGDAVDVALPGSEAARLNRALAEQGVYLAELRPVEASLEEVFLELTREEAGA